MKTSELTGAALDWAVAKAWQPVYTDSHLVRVVTRCIAGLEHYHPSTSWAQGGPIIEREKIDVFHQDNGYAGAIKMATDADPHPGPYFGLTSLIAAMRCYVASKLGDEVEVPDGLL